MAYDVDLSKIEYMRDYIAHLKYARDRLMETYTQVYQHSRYIANDVWQDTVSQQFMQILEHKEQELRGISEALDKYQEIMSSQLEVLEETAQQQVD